MKKIIYLLLIISINTFSQNFNRIVKKDIIFIGEYHYYNNNIIELNIIKKTISKTNANLIVAIEDSPDLEYWLNLKDTIGLKYFFIYNTDRYFRKDTFSTLNKIKYEFYKEALKIIKNKETKFYSFDSFYINRSLYYTLYQIIHRNNNEFLYYNELHSLDSLLKSNNIEKKDTVLFTQIKQKFYKDSVSLKGKISPYDFLYLTKIFATPFLPAFSQKREKYIANKLSIADIDSKILCITGAGHIKKRTGIFRSKSFKKMKKKMIYIAIIPKNLFTINLRKKFDSYYLNSSDNILKNR